MYIYHHVSVSFTIRNAHTHTVCIIMRIHSAGSFTEGKRNETIKAQCNNIT